MMQMYVLIRLSAFSTLYYDNNMSHWIVMASRGAPYSNTQDKAEMHEVKLCWRIKIKTELDFFFFDRKWQHVCRWCRDVRRGVRTIPKPGLYPAAPKQCFIIQNFILKSFLRAKKTPNMLASILGECKNMTQDIENYDFVFQQCSYHPFKIKLCAYRLLIWGLLLYVNLTVKPLQFICSHEKKCYLLVCIFLCVESVGLFPCEGLGMTLNL